MAADVTRDTVLEARGLSKPYRMGDVEIDALRGGDLALRGGEFAALLGPSGSGKGTLLNVLGGLDAPTAGEVRYRGAALDFGDDRALTPYRREHVGFVFQFYNLMPSLTARENVALVTDIAEDPMRPEEALALVGLSARLDHFPAQLSGGEQQRVAIARAVARRPDMLVCDEPTGALDCATGLVVLDVIARVNRELGATTAVITHNAVIARMPAPPPVLHRLRIAIKKLRYALDFFVGALPREGADVPRWPCAPCPSSDGATRRGRCFHAVPFGGAAEEERTFEGFTIPTKLRVGWYFGTERFEPEGGFFRCNIERATFR